MGIVKRILDVIAALLVTGFAPVVTWMTIAQAKVEPEAPPGVDWDSILGPTTIFVFGVLACTRAGSRAWMSNLSRTALHECDFPACPQCARLNCSEPPRGMVRTVHWSPA